MTGRRILIPGSETKQGKHPARQFIGLRWSSQLLSLLSAICLASMRTSRSRCLGAAVTNEADAQVPLKQRPFEVNENVRHWCVVGSISIGFSAGDGEGLGADIRGWDLALQSEV